MLKEESNINSWARVCDTCRSAPCTVYCRADSAYLCTGCDVRIHAAGAASSRHERVWVCEACERAPAAFLCKADAASLCTACDADIHSANPLARRHHRVPILPISGCLYGPQANGPVELDADGHRGLGDDTVNQDDDEDEAASWLLIDPVKNIINPSSNRHGCLFGDEGGDEYLDLGQYNPCQDGQFTDHYRKEQEQDIVVPHKSYGGDSVVPIRSEEAKLHQQQHQQYHNYHFQVMDYETSKAGYSYPASLSHSVSVSSMDMGIVPEPATSDISVSHPRPPKGTIDLFSNHPIHAATQFSPMDREARVLRYREKKKTRRFEKTIRYASRKAYAETRPRIKGRFAKRTNVEAEVDQMFSTTLIAEGGYGIVPSF